MNRRILAAVFTTSLLIFSQAAWAGRLHPELETRLSALPQGGTLSVIVEMVNQADPAAAAATVPRGQRLARKRAVVDVLRDVANRDQASILAFIAREQSLGSVQRVIPFWVFNGLAVTATEPVIRRLAARPDVWEVRPDASIPAPQPIRPAATPGPSASVSEWNIAQIRAPEVWTLNPNYTGVGSVVGSFDTGVDLTHPDLQPRYRGNHNTSWFDPYREHASPFDPNGHGTHTTGTAVGGDASGSNIGVAPGAKWIAAKAWNDLGIGLTSAFHQIFEWFLAPGGDPANAPDVVNSSWGFGTAGCITEFRADVQALRAAGIFPAFAAGNDGPDEGSVRSPGAGPESFATGATDFFDDIAFFSARGPSPCDGSVKPDLSAPGVGIVSSIPGGYVESSGTSMATPHVTGAVAVLRSVNPTLTVDELEAVLVQGAVDLGLAGPDDSFGAGRLDLFQSAQIVLGGVNRPVVTIVATDAVATEAGQTTATFTVRRTGPTDEALTVGYAVSGSTTPGSDYLTLPGSATIPAGSATATIVVIPLDDTLVEPDETVIVTLSADPAYIVGTPGRATVTIISDEIPPDLIVSALSVPAAVGAGAAFTVSDTTMNQGGGPAPASTTKFYLSPDAVLDATDVLLESRAVPALAPGAISAGSTAMTIPTGTLPGAYYVIVKADADNLVVETHEGNNIYMPLVQVRVDLTITPSAIDLAAPPASFTITGGGFANLGFGLPVVNFARNGVVLAQARATAMTGSTTLTVPFPTAATAIAPNLPGLSAGTMDVQVYLQTGTASYSLLGSGTLTVSDTRPAPGVSAITPNSIDLATPPASFTITGGGFANLGFGLPVVNFVRNGVILAQARATAMTGSTTLTVPFPTSATAIAPNLPGLSAGTVNVQVYLQTGAASYSLLGSGTLTVSDTRPAPGVSAITPNSIDLATPPASFTITGNGFANLGFGLPVVNFARNGVILAQARATALTGGTTLTVPFPTSATAIASNLPGLSPGTVNVQVYLQSGAASYSLLGSATLTVSDTRPAPGVSAITPTSIDLVDPPASFTITGGGFANLGFGLPVVNFARNGVVLAQARAMALAGGTTLTVPFPTAATAIAPNLPGLSAGTVNVQVYLQSGAASYSLLGSAPLTITDTRPAPAITPNSIDLAAPPASFTITGSGFANVGFGLPVVNFARNGVVLAQARATALAGGTTLTVPFPTSATAIAPNLPGLSAGTVDVQVYLQTGAASFSLLGGNLTLTVR
ncbi:MAG TPA: S8 family serine peptidase [Methylomirabilota bacterium]|nr:S8 family serine peptidase [Methylomirabilota bacterium]